MYDIHQDPVRAMIVHHRIPTSSDNKIKQTHPMSVDNGSLKYKYLVIHNGVIQNDDELKKEHEDLGFQYTTIDGNRFNDSECCAIEVARFIEGQTDKIGTRGSTAFICVQIDKETNKVTEVFFGRNDANPLKMAKTREKLFLSSTGPGVDVAPFKLYHFELDSEMKLNKRTMNFAAEIPKPVTVWKTTEVLKGRQLTVQEQRKRDEEDWEDYNSYNSVKPARRTYESALDNDLPPDEEESGEDEIVELVEETHQFVMEEFDNFVDMLYEPTSIDYVTEDDIEVTVANIKDKLLELLGSAKEKHLEIALEKEANTIGYQA